MGQRVKDDIAKSKGDRVLQRSCEPILSLAVATWRKKDISLLSFEYISLRCLSSHQICLNCQAFVILILIKIN